MVRRQENFKFCMNMPSHIPNLYFNLKGILCFTLPRWNGTVYVLRITDKKEFNIKKSEKQSPRLCVCVFVHQWSNRNVSTKVCDLPKTNKTHSEERFMCITNFTIWQQNSQQPLQSQNEQQFQMTWHFLIWHIARGGKDWGL